MLSAVTVAALKTGLITGAEAGLSTVKPRIEKLLSKVVERFAVEVESKIAKSLAPGMPGAQLVAVLQRASVVPDQVWSAWVFETAIRETATHKVAAHVASEGRNEGPVFRTDRMNLGFMGLKVVVPIRQWDLTGRGSGTPAT